MLSAIVILFAVVVFMVGLHLYARWYLLRLRRRQLERRRQRRGGRTHIVFYADNNQPRAAADRGLEPAVLNSLPVFLHLPKTEQPLLECAVCLSEFEEKEIVRLLPKCNHSFHIQCIDMWFHSHSTCPLCRSPVEPVVNRVEPEVEVVEPEVMGQGSSSSDSGLCATCQEGSGCGTTSFGGRRKGLEMVGVRIEVPPRRVELNSELTQSSPGSRLLSLKRILSMGRKSPMGGGSTTPRGVGTSRGPLELDLESGLSESTRVPTPR
ncbi:hypothetical protein ACJIZ3_014209 [Penstemon smallii]|uniref:RING-type E3 ubiquitin transferase n=1 Tax=Penstemon smallii TaxID=265156 RepID=A0ABD3RMD7_9LAMI